MTISFTFLHIFWQLLIHSHFRSIIIFIIPSVIFQQIQTYNLSKAAICSSRGKMPSWEQLYQNTIDTGIPLSKSSKYYRYEHIF